MYEHLDKVKNIEVYNFTKYFVLFMLFFPSITFGVFGDNVEVFPWGIIFGLIYMNRVFVHYLMFFIFFTPWFLFAVYNDITNFEIYRSLASYFNAIIAFFIILEFNKKEIKQLYLVLKISFFLFLVISFFQFYFDIFLLETLSKILTPRAAVGPDNVGVTQRGVSGLSSEQSRAALELVLMASVLICVEKKIRNNANLFFIFLMYFLFFINKSLTSAVYLIVLYICFLFATKPINFKIFIFILISSASLMILTINIFSYLPAEIYNLNRVFATLHDLSGRSLENVIIKVYEHSGLRVSSQLAIYLEPTFFGNGVGEAKQAIRDGIAKNEFLKCCQNNWYTHNPNEFTRHRASSFLAVIISELGLVGATIFFYYIYYTARSKINTFKNRNNIMILVSGFSIFILGTTGSPIPFMCIALILKISLYQLNAK